MKEGLLLIELLEVMDEKEQNEILDLLSNQKSNELKETLIKILKKYKENLSYLF